MPERAFGDKRVQGDKLVAAEAAGYVADAISRWPGIAQNGLIADRNAIQDLILNDQDRINENAKYFFSQMYGRYVTQLGHPTNFIDKKAKKDYEKEKAKDKKILVAKLNWWYEIVLGPNNNMTQFSLFGYDMSQIPARRYMVFTCSKNPTDNTWRNNTTALRSVDDDDDDANEAELEKEAEDLLSFEYVDDDDDDDDKNLQLPPNFQSVLGGIDASCAAFSREGFKGNLFNVANTEGNTYSCYVDGRTVEFAVPPYLTMTWGSESTSFSIVGESKKEFTSKLSKKLNLEADFFGFGGEFERTFDETRTEETFKKYMARYNQEVVYTISFKDEDSAAKYLSDDALTAMKTWTPEKIVASFGTHYTVQATIGGSRIVASSLDTRDEFTETEMSTAIELKAKFKDAKGGDVGSAGAETSTTDTKSQKLFESLQTVNTHTIGGTATDDKEILDSWRQSLTTNPALINYKLRPIEELVPADLTVEQKNADGKTVAVLKRSLVKKAARAIIDAQAPVDHCTVLAIKVPLKPYYSDHGSHAKHDISVAYPDVPKGWLRVAQFAQGASMEYAFQGQSYTYAVRANPNLDLLGTHGPCPCPGVVAATHANIIWTGRTDIYIGEGMPPAPSFWRPYYQPYNETQIKADYKKIIEAGGSLGLGLDVNKPLNGQYIPLGDIFEPLPYGQKELTNLNSLAVFHKDMIVKLKKAVNTSLDVHWIWDDSGSRAKTDVTVLGLPISRGNLGPNDETLLMEPAPETSTALPFWCAERSVDPTKFDGVTLDWTKVKILRNEWLSK